jgi:D-3-phosphoglycerate dehydrogenase
MRALVADKFPARHLAALRGLLAVDDRPEVPVADLAHVASGATVLIVRGKQVGPEVFERCPSLALVVRAGAGVNTIDVAAASAHGVYVSNCPGKNSIAVAELALGLLVSIDRRIPDNVASLRAGKWDKKTFSEARGLHGRALGIVGLGSIGREVATRARAFGMRVAAWSRSLSDADAARAGVARASSLLDLARTSDVLSVHVPLSAETRGLVSRAVLAALPDGAVFINTARAEVVDQEALLDEAKRGRLFVGTDVFPAEPEKGKADFDSPLGRLPNVYGTHHIGASTDQAQDAIAEEAVAIVRAFVEKGTVPNCVNLARRTPARCQILVRHKDVVGVLANVLDVIRRAGINVQEVSNHVFEGAKAACCKIQLDQAPSPEVLAAIRSRTDEVIFVDQVDLPS